MTYEIAKAIDIEKAWTESDLKKYHGVSFARKMRNEDAVVDVHEYLGTTLYNDLNLDLCYEADVWLVDFYRAGDRVYDPPRRGLMIIPVGDIVIHDPLTNERRTPESLVDKLSVIRFYRTLAVSMLEEREKGEA